MTGGERKLQPKAQLPLILLFKFPLPLHVICVLNCRHYYEVYKGGCMREYFVENNFQ
jgi:hypothetical protein